MSAYYTFLTNRGPSRLIESLASRYKSARDRAGNSLIMPKPSQMPGSELWTPAPPPKTGLGRYRVLSSRAGIRVSPIQLGTFTACSPSHDPAVSDDATMGGLALGTDITRKKSSIEVLDAYFDAGGNFIDISSNRCVPLSQCLKRHRFISLQSRREVRGNRGRVG